MPRTGASNKSPPNETARSRAGDRWSAAGAGRLSWCGSSAAAWQLSFGTPQHTRVAGLLAKADRLRLRTARSPCRAPRQWPAASSHGARPGACPCRRLPLFQPPVLAPQPPTGHVERPTKRQHTSFSRSGVVRWALAGASSTPPAGDRADRPILGLAQTRAVDGQKHALLAWLYWHYLPLHLVLSPRSGWWLPKTCQHPACCLGVCCLELSCCLAVLLSCQLS